MSADSLTPTSRNFYAPTSRNFYERVKGKMVLSIFAGALGMMLLAFACLNYIARKSPF